MIFKKTDKPEATKIEKAASGFSDGQLRDYLLVYVNSLGTAANLLVKHNKREALDTIPDNCHCIIALIEEIGRRNPDDFVEIPDLHMQELVGKFLRR